MNIFQGIRAEVFRLNESSLWYELLIQPEACCMKWANEVDYVIPILTPNFLQHVHGVNHEGDDGSLLPTCPIVNRYMYTLLRARFVNLGCKNTIIRPVIPQEFVRTVGQATVIKNDPLFRLVWVPLAEDRVVGRAKAMLGEFAKKVEG